MNTVSLVGRLTKNPELRYTPSQIAVSQFTLAVNRPVKKEGQQEADFIRITVFGKSAENCHAYLMKGSLAGVQGRIQTGSYEKDGKRYYTTDVIAERVEFLAKPQNAEQKPAAYPGAEDPNYDPSLPPGFYNMDDDDENLPF